MAAEVCSTVAACCSHRFERSLAVPAIAAKQSGEPRAEAALRSRRAGRAMPRCCSRRTGSGWNAATYISGELDNPQRHLPVVLFASTALVAASYLLLNYVFLSVAPITAMASTAAPMISRPLADSFCRNSRMAVIGMDSPYASRGVKLPARIYQLSLSR